MYSLIQTIYAFSMLSHFWLPVESTFVCDNGGELVCCTLNTVVFLDNAVDAFRHDNSVGVFPDCGKRDGWDIAEKGCSGEGYPGPTLRPDRIACCTGHYVNGNPSSKPMCLLYAILRYSG